MHPGMRGSKHWRLHVGNWRSLHAFRGRDHRHRSKLTADRMLRAVGHTPMGNCYFPFAERHATTAGLREARSLRHLGRQPPTVFTAGTGWLPHPTKEEISLRRRIKWDNLLCTVLPEFWDVVPSCAAPHAPVYVPPRRRLAGSPDRPGPPIGAVLSVASSRGRTTPR